MQPARELEWHRFVRTLRTQVASAHDDTTAARLLVRAARAMLTARSVALVTLAADGEVEVRQSSGAVEPDDGAALRDYLGGGEWPRPAATELLAPVERRQRRWALLVARGDSAFRAGEGHGLVLLAEVLAARVQELDRRRASEVRARIDRKIMTQLRPQDLCYQILHGLRSLTEYDHAGALYVSDHEAGRLRLAAEQVAWHKSKSARIGLRLQLRPDDRAALLAGETCGFDRRSGGWSSWRGRAGPELARSFLWGADAPPAGSMLLAPLVAGPELLGVIALTGAHAGRLGAYEADLLQRFLPQAAIAIGNAEKTAFLEASVLRAERKHAMADLARGVAHDVNNALGAVLPVVQQLQVELREGCVEPQAMREDLARVEDAVVTCRRIFGGMLAFAKGAAGRGARYGDVRRAVDSAVNILQGGAARRGVTFAVRVPPHLPSVSGAQHELEQLFLNLMSNAHDAMTQGGELQVVAESAPASGTLTVRVVDNGKGMTRAELARVDEAFYTTKPNGTGLGLAICRSIVGDIGGRMTMVSEPGVGTTVELTLPVHGASPRGAEAAS